MTYRNKKLIISLLTSLLIVAILMVTYIIYSLISTKKSINSMLTTISKNYLLKECGKVKHKIKCIEDKLSTIKKLHSFALVYENNNLKGIIKEEGKKGFNYNELKEKRIIDSFHKTVVHLNENLHIVFFTSYTKILTLFKKDILVLLVISVFAVLLSLLLNLFLTHKTTKELEEANENFRRIFLFSPNPIVIHNIKKIIDLNNAAVDFLEIDKKEDIIGKNPIDFIHPDFKEAVSERLKMIEKDSIFLPAKEEMLTLPNGKIKYALVAPVKVKIKGKQNVLVFLFDITEIKELQSKLSNTKEHLENVYNSSDFIIFSFNKDYKLLSFNKNFKKFFKIINDIDIKEGDYILDKLPNTKKDIFKKYAEKAFKGGKSTIISEVKTRTKDLLFVKIIFIPLKDIKGNITGATVFAEDTTEKHKKEQELRLLSKIIEEANIGVIILSEDLKIIFINDFLVNIGGWRSKGEIIGKNALDLIKKELREDVKNKIIPILKNKNSWRGELEILKKNGEALPVEIIASPIVGFDGRTNYTIIINDITERKLTEKALKESYEFIKSVFSSIPAAVFSKDREGRYTIVNEEFAEYLGLTPEEVIGKTVYEVWPVDEAKVYHQKDLELMEKGGHQVYEFVLPHKKRGKVPGLFYKECFYDLEGNVAGLTGVFLDITEIKKLKEALKESEEKSSILLSLIPDIIFVLDADGKFLDYHAPKEEELYTEPENFIGKNAYDVLPEELAELTIKSIKKALSLKKLVVFEYSINIKGKQKWQEARIIQKNKDEVMVLIRDITEKKKAEEKLLKSEQRLRMIIENAPLIILGTKKSNKIFMFNKKAKEVFNAKIETIKTFNNLTHKFIKKDKRKFIKHFKIANGTFKEFLVKVNEREFTLLWANFKLKDGSIISMGYDITEEKKLKDQLTQSQKMEAIGLLSGGIAHDFNNILAVIKGYSDIALMKIKKELDVQKEIQRIISATNKAKELIEKLLIFTRKQPERFEIININSLIKELTETFKRLIPSDITLKIDFYEEDIYIKANPNHLEQVIINLIINAKDAIEEKKEKSKKEIQIKIYKKRIEEESNETQIPIKKGEYAVISVSDTGKGMSKDVHEKIFEPFFTTKEREKGTGLGLSTVFGIVKQYGGAIEVKSEPGKGSTFRIYFPLIKEPDEEIGKEKDIKKEVKTGDETILIAEDNDSVRDFLSETLKMLGYKVFVAKNGKEAIEIFKSKKNIDLLITDIVMPEMRGDELVKTLKDKFPEIKVIFISGYIDKELVDNIEIDKEVNFIQEPFSIEDISELIRKVLGK